MKSIRTFVTLVGLSLVLITLGSLGAKAQGLSAVKFAGSFTLPFQAKWGGMTLPAGNYTFEYGIRFGAHLVEVQGAAKGSPRGLIPVYKNSATSASKNGLVCIRTGNTGIVRDLELPAIGTSLAFGLPRGEQILARKQNHKAYPQLAGGPMLIQRVPVTPSGK